MANNRQKQQVEKNNNSPKQNDAAIKKCGSAMLYETVFFPVLENFVLWVLQKAQENRIDRLYFLARDGYQMYIAAQKFCEIYNVPVECRYLKVSRFSVRVPEYHLLGKKCLERICIGGIDVTFEKVMQRAALTEIEIHEISQRCGFLGREQQILTYQEIMQLKPKLEEMELFFEFVNAHSKAAFESAIGYFEQEGLFEHVSYALVDSGWIGTIQQSIQNLLRQKQPNIQLRGYYFGLYEIPKTEKKECYQTFYFSPWNQLRRKVYFSNCLFETVFSAPEGMTVGYVKQQERYLPITENPKNQNQKQMEEYVFLLSKLLSFYKKDFSFKPDMKKVQKLLKNFMGNPNKEQAQIFGELFFCDDVKENTVQKVSAQLKESEIKNYYLIQRLLIMLGIKKTVLHESAWIEGSIALFISNEKTRKKYLRHVVLYKYLIYIRKWIKQTFGRRG